MSSGGWGPTHVQGRHTSKGETHEWASQQSDHGSTLHEENWGASTFSLLYLRFLLTWQAQVAGGSPGHSLAPNRGRLAVCASHRGSAQRRHRGKGSCGESFAFEVYAPLEGSRDACDPRLEDKMVGDTLQPALTAGRAWTRFDVAAQHQAPLVW
jgi:hypothetical protein